jgi:hypothetical protein
MCRAEKIQPISTMISDCYHIVLGKFAKAHEKADDVGNVSDYYRNEIGVYRKYIGRYHTDIQKRHFTRLGMSSLQSMTDLPLEKAIEYSATPSPAAKMA